MINTNNVKQTLPQVNQKKGKQAPDHFLDGSLSSIDRVGLFIGIHCRADC